MSEQTKNLVQIGLEILQASRNELYMNMPYLDVVLCALAFRDGTGVTLSIATDGADSQATPLSVPYRRYGTYLLPKNRFAFIYPSYISIDAHFQRLNCLFFMADNNSIS